MATTSTTVILIPPRRVPWSELRAPAFAGRGGLADGGAIGEGEAGGSDGSDKGTGGVTGGGVGGGGATDTGTVAALTISRSTAVTSTPRVENAVDALFAS